jgi:hypothetical protein
MSVFTGGQYAGTPRLINSMGAGPRLPHDTAKIMTAQAKSMTNSFSIFSPFIKASAA